MRCCARIQAGVRLGVDERRDGFRADIEGLRGVAVLAVVVYHAGLGVVGGGFVGVDVFYVLSGFLITGLLWEELQRTGRLRFGEFYARRARRLLPAAVVVLVVTVAASAIWLSPLQARVSRQVRAQASEHRGVPVRSRTPFGWWTGAEASKPGSLSP
jgi:peptidoglycan/LPS O-acetylase OafA/YrhL